MRKFTIFVLWFAACVLPVAARVVYTTQSQNAKRYHLTRDCKGLQQSKTRVRLVSEAEAKREGKSLCKICEGDAGGGSAAGGKPQAVASKASTPSTPKLDKLELARTKAGVTAEVVQHVGYTTSYNENWLIPNWVAWVMSPARVDGPFPRPKRPFEPDPAVKGRSCEHSDYSNSGYSRGHMAPAADMKWSEVAMNESFYLSNVCPQLAALNTSVWNRLEEKTRNLARQGSTVYVCSGPIVESDCLRIGPNGVAVPARFFKVLLRQLNGKWVGVGFIFPNAECKGGMFDYAMSIDEVEARTCIDFFYNLPDDEESAVESVWRQRDWQ